MRKLAHTAAKPEFVRAWLIWKEHAIATYNTQLIASRASWAQRRPIATITTPNTSNVEQINKVKFSKSNPDTTNMVVTMRITARIIYFVQDGAESFTSAKSAKAWSLLELFLIKVGSASSRSTSPACSLIFPGSHEYDDLYDKQKSLWRHIWCGNPIKLLYTARRIHCQEVW